MANGLYVLEYLGPNRPFVLLDEKLNEIPSQNMIFRITGTTDKTVIIYDQRRLGPPIPYGLDPSRPTAPNGDGTEDSFPCLGRWIFKTRSELNSWILTARNKSIATADASFPRRRVIFGAYRPKPITRIKPVPVTP